MNEKINEEVFTAKSPKINALFVLRKQKYVFAQKNIYLELTNLLFSVNYLIIGKIVWGND